MELGRSYATAVGLYGDVLQRELDLQQRISEYSRDRASEEQICEDLDISKATCGVRCGGRSRRKRFSPR